MDFSRVLKRAESVYPDFPVGDIGGRCSVTLENGECCNRKAILGTGSSTICYAHAVACLEMVARRFGKCRWGIPGKREMLFWLACGPVESIEENEQ